ncbi:MAG: 2-C-methyl-D-erythritol 4-phosphate cytidylyltransferase [Deltaproteobacteria bacterium]|nr:2-C-methyl-D-erythritol 4-phosphate cytidylyltransferase [Deltaproteobacteria bacterium]MBI2348432.1 2-C-methyl-D-erythritol 4-phosphate cytidylyltransferase [Deltaproteobacteria bacterium]MBI2539606.1 2-C-methyl-D-erythritol 4-phosphate cytidylyltransferase [Deltaproteobacteria bacterium]MBI2991666.1 2-C-methyl-D-erythritol 4-phosphate cytidylyltransferase [Deltaproteobacteria bacterium]
MRVNAVIVAAGEGKRMGANVPKPFLPLGGRPLILHTLSRFATSQVRKLVLVAAAGDISRYPKLIQSDPQLSGLEFVFQAGGPRRQDSVRHGLSRLDPDCEVVVIHDGARPFVAPEIIDRCVEAAFREGAVVVGVPVSSTVKVVSSSRRVKETPPRDRLWEIQTPQAFQTEIIREAFRKASRKDTDVTDDATLVERLGRSVAVLEGMRTNIKITVPEDLLFAEALLRKGLAP